MAKRTMVELIDDLSGEPADETVTFELDGVNYEIDLSAANASKMRDALAPYVSAASKTTSDGRRYRRTTSRPDAKTLRAWAEANRVKVPAKGRIPKAVIEQYEAAHNL